MMHKVQTDPLSHKLVDSFPHDRIIHTNAYFSYVSSSNFFFFETYGSLIAGEPFWESTTSMQSYTVLYLPN